MAMDSEIKARWIAALRSGEFAQGAGWLRTDGDDESRYCCLGVLCEMATQDGTIPPFSPRDGYGGQFTMPSLLVRAWSNADRNDIPYGNRDWLVAVDDATKAAMSPAAVLEIVNGTASVAVLNDDGFTFEQIANLIEADDLFPRQMGEI